MNRIIERIVELLKEYVLDNRGIKVIYKGDPIYIPEEDMPFVFVQPNSTATNTLDSAEDEEIYDISISVVANDMQYINDLREEEAGIFELAKIMEEKDSTTNKLKQNTIKDVVRFRLDSDSDYVVAAGTIVTDYAFRMRAARYSEDIKDYYPTIEATLTFQARGIGYLRD